MQCSVVQLHNLLNTVKISKSKPQNVKDKTTLLAPFKKTTNAHHLSRTIAGRSCTEDMTVNRNFVLFSVLGFIHNQIVLYYKYIISHD